MGICGLAVLFLRARCLQGGHLERVGVLGARHLQPRRVYNPGTTPVPRIRIPRQWGHGGRIDGYIPLGRIADLRRRQCNPCRSPRGCRIRARDRSGREGFLGALDGVRPRLGGSFEDWSDGRLRLALGCRRDAPCEFLGLTRGAWSLFPACAVAIL